MRWLNAIKDALLKVHYRGCYLIRLYDWNLTAFVSLNHTENRAVQAELSTGTRWLWLSVAAELNCDAAWLQ